MTILGLHKQVYTQDIYSFVSLYLFVSLKHSTNPLMGRYRFLLF